MHLASRFPAAFIALAGAISLAACGSEDVAEPPVRATPIPSSSALPQPTVTETVSATVTETVPGTASATEAETEAVAAPSSAAVQPDGVIVRAGLGEAGKNASYPACDGRAILILDSVIDEQNDGAAMQDIARHVLAAHPSGEPVQFTVPGACPSLREQLEGQNIYPIYIDYGSDVSAMCRAKGLYGGNGRLLNNDPEYVDPC